MKWYYFSCVHRSKGVQSCLFRWENSMQEPIVDNDYLEAGLVDVFHYVC